VSQSESQFKGIRGFFWLAAGFLLLADALGSAGYAVGCIVLGACLLDRSRHHPG